MLFVDKHCFCPYFCSEILYLLQGFFKGVLGTRFGSLDFKIGSLESEKIIIGSLDTGKIGYLELEKSGPYRSIPGI